MGGLGGDTRRLQSRPLSRAFFEVDAATLAERLLGCVLVRELAGGERMAGRIVETEAYVGLRDRASHAFGGRRTARNESMYGRAGIAYVYFTYGMHHCFNVVCASAGDPQAVLVRALEPVEGLARMREHRAGAGASDGGARGPAMKERMLCSGPARLCEAMRIDRAMDGHDLNRAGAVWIGEPSGEEPAVRMERGERVRRAARIGVDYAGAWASRRLRWVLDGNPNVSRRVGGRPGVGVRGTRLESAWSREGAWRGWLKSSLSAIVAEAEFLGP